MQDPVNGIDPNGLNSYRFALIGGRLGALAGSVFSPVGTIVGGALGAGAGAAIGWLITGPMFQQENPSENPPNEDPVVYPNNPQNSPEEFGNIKGSRGKICTTDGSVWEKDTSSHGGDQWKKWPDKKSWEKGNTPNSI